MNDNEPELLRLTPDEALDWLVQRAAELLDEKPGRVALGLAGGPGVGKSTLATGLVDRLNAGTPGIAAYVPMDGFHMRHLKLERLGTTQDKGAPHTFEGQAFVDFLSTLKAASGPVHGPLYSREIEDVVDNAFTVPGEVRLLVVEGNYLLLATAPWWQVKPQLDLSVFIDLSVETVRARLLKRHAEHGLFSEARNIEHIERVDLNNFALVSRSRSRADVVIELETQA